ncbi:MAG: extracellular solute-binding protein [Clostridia bacterium]|nr:extracellular solute-binding protein [Clostridia bacterium]
MQNKALRLLAGFMSVVMVFGLVCTVPFGCLATEALTSGEAIAVNLKNSADAVFEGDSLVWQSDKELNLGFTAENEGIFELSVVWKPMENGVNPEISVKIDGKYPFEKAENIEMLREWKNLTDKPRQDKIGNEYAAEQVETGEFITTALRDYTGSSAEPYAFSLSSGEHTLTLKGDGQKLLIKSITFVTPDSPKSYKGTFKPSKAEKINAQPILLQGEKADIKSGDFLIPKANNSDAGMNPTDKRATKINYIGGSTWQNPGDYLKWNFEVEKSGYYYLNFRFKQSELVNGDSFRRLKIDDKLPFEEARTVKFVYDTDWQNDTYSDSKNNPYYIYLEKGSHTLTLEVDSSNQVEYFNRLSSVVSSLGDEYIKIVMITGETPDVNRDYQLFDQIPNFNDTLKKNNDELIALSKDMKKNSGKRATQIIAAMDNMSRILSIMLKSPYIAHQYVKDFYSNYTSLSSWLYDMTNMPLAIDTIQFVPYGSEPKLNEKNIFERFAYGFMRFIYSFVEDYAEAEQGESNQSVRLWVNWGQDQSSVLSSLIEDSFTAKTGIKVKLEIVNASLVNGILAGNFPDVALHLARTEPVNLGIRGALADLRQFDDCDEVLKRFNTGAHVPYCYGDALYALPDTQSFMLMFYRTDILDQLGIKVPETWEEFLQASTIIQRNNMNTYVPYTQIVASTTVNAGIGNLNLFPTLLAQSGLSLYNPELNATDINNEPAIEVFKTWASLYNEYSLNKEADFYNRFRNGVMPLGIAPYGTYMTIYSAAPEIKGRWSVATVPGSKDGNKLVAGAGTGCAIIEKSPNKKAAWEFLKWWTSEETQFRYSKNVESILGMIGRTATANKNAMKRLAWNSHDRDVILEQWSYVQEVPEVPGSYYVTRAVDQAFWSVVNDNSTVKDAVAKWSNFADDEITRKIKEYS